MESPQLDRQTPYQLARARILLREPHRRDPAWPALAAAAFFALCAMTFAVTSIMTPSKDYAPLPAAHGK